MILRFNDYHKAKMLKEAALNPQQLNLFDDAFSSKTIVETMLQEYKAKAPIILDDNIKTIDQAVQFLEDEDEIKSQLDGILSGDAMESYDYISFDRDDLANKIAQLDENEFYSMFSNMLMYEVPVDESNEYYSLFFNEEGELLDEVTFKDNFEHFRPSDASYELADALIDNDKDTAYSLRDIFDHDIVDDLVRTEVMDNYHSHIEMTYRDHLVNNVSNAEDGKINIYRAITVPYSVKSLRGNMHGNSGVGIYWSHEHSGAIAHNGGSHRDGFTMIISAQVYVTNVNWQATLHKALWTLNEEMEIEVKDSCTVDVVAVEIKNGDEQRIEKSLTHYYMDLGMEPGDMLQAVQHMLSNKARIDFEDDPFTVHV